MAESAGDNSFAKVSKWMGSDADLDAKARRTDLHCLPALFGDSWRIIRLKFRMRLTLEE